MRHRSLALCCSLWLAGATAGAQDNALESSAETFQLPLLTDPPLPPPSDAVGERIELPARPRLRLQAEAGVQWYRWRIGKPDRDELHALYILQANANAVVYLNGQWIGQGGRFFEPTAHTWYRPLYFRFAAARLDRDQNQLDVGLLLTGSVFHVLSAPVLAPDRTLLPRYQRAFALRIPPAQASTLLSLAIVFLFGGLAFALRQATYATLAAAGGCYAVHSLNYHYLEPPVSTWVFNTLTNLCMQWAGCALALLGFLWANVGGRWIVPLVTSVAALCGLAAWCLPPRSYEQVMIAGYIVCGALAASGFVAVWRSRRSMPMTEWLVYFATACMLVPIALRDIAVQLWHQDRSSRLDDVFLVSYFGPLMLIGASASLLVRFVHVYRSAQYVNQHLEAEIARKSAELTRHHETMRAIEKRQVLLEERERMMREMHDGVGGHLVAAISLVEHNQRPGSELMQTLRDALDDVRLIVHALEPLSDDISLLLAEMRSQLEPRLRARGLRFRWDVADRTNARTVGPFGGLQVRRILQEAITNTLKHAAATVIRVSSGSTEGAVPGYYIEIADDGTGFDPPARSGRGIANMRRRADRIGAQLTIHTSPSGTRVRLLLPENIKASAAE